MALGLRFASARDLAPIANVLAAAFDDEELNDHLFPRRKEYPDDYARAWRQNVTEKWWDYRRVWVVAPREEQGVQVLAGVAQWTKVLVAGRADVERGLWGVRRWDLSKSYALFPPRQTA